MKTLKAGQKVNIEFFDENKDVKSLDCEITVVEYDRLYLKSENQDINLLKCLNEGSSICVFIYTGSGIRYFKSIVLASPFDGFVVEYPNEFENIQRRKFVRAKWENEAIVVRNKGESFKVETLDIGGEAIRFKSPKKLEQNEMVSLRLCIDKFMPSIIIEGRIDKKIHFDENEYLFYYVNINENNRNKIIKKCLEIQVCELWDK